MALAAELVWELRTTGSDNSGGAFKAGASGVDRSQQNAAHATMTTASTVNATTTIINVNAGDYTVTADDVGNVLQVTGGTATAGFYEITAADTTNNRWTVDRAVGTAGQTVAGAMGGALATPGKCAGAIVGGNTVWQKAGTYSCTNSSNVAGGRVTISVNGSESAPTRWYGYQTTRADGGTYPVLQATANSVNVFTVSGSHAALRWLQTGKSAAQTSTVGFNVTGVGSRVEDCTASGNATGFTGGSASGEWDNCLATGCTSTGFSVAAAMTLFACAAVDGGGGASGFSLAIAGGQVIRCVSAGNQTGFALSANCTRADNCAAHGNGQHGFNVTGHTATLANCVSWGNTGDDFNSATTPDPVNTRLYHCAGAEQNFAAESVIGFVTLTADPFTDAANDDFTLNDDAGGGAACKAAGYPTGLPGLTGTSAPDIGAYQGDASAGGGGSGGGRVCRLGL
jgi:hypothetical protein